MNNLKAAALLRVVADFFDQYDADNGIQDDRSVQRDLREIADGLEEEA